MAFVVVCIGCKRRNENEEYQSLVKEPINNIVL